MLGLTYQTLKHFHSKQHYPSPLGPSSCPFAPFNFETHSIPGHSLFVIAHGRKSYLILKSKCYTNEKQGALNFELLTSNVEVPL